MVYVPVDNNGALLFFINPSKWTNVTFWFLHNRISNKTIVGIGKNLEIDKTRISFIEKRFNNRRKISVIDRKTKWNEWDGDENFKEK